MGDLAPGLVDVTSSDQATQRLSGHDGWLNRLGGMCTYMLHTKAVMAHELLASPLPWPTETASQPHALRLRFGLRQDERERSVSLAYTMRKHSGKSLLGDH